MLRTNPAVSLRNFTPSSTPLPSAVAATRGVAAALQIEHGHVAARAAAGAPRRPASTARSSRLRGRRAINLATIRCRRPGLTWPRGESPALPAHDGGRVGRRGEGLRMAGAVRGHLPDLARAAVQHMAVVEPL